MRNTRRVFRSAEPIDLCKEALAASRNQPLRWLGTSRHERFRCRRQGAGEGGGGTVYPFRENAGAARADCAGWKRKRLGLEIAVREYRL